MSLHLKSITRDAARRLVATYEMRQQSKTTTLSFDLTLTIDDSGCHTKIAFEGKSGETPEAALGLLADWLERTAKGIRENKEPAMMLPIWSKW